MNDIDTQILSAERHLAELKEKKAQIDATPFPKRVDIFPSTSYESIYNIGVNLGLVGSALDWFSRHDEFHISAIVEDDGRISEANLVFNPMTREELIEFINKYK